MGAIVRNGEIYGSNMAINDAQTSENTTWSSEKIDSEIKNQGFKVETIMVHGSNAAGTPSSVTAPVISGYTPIGIVCYAASGNENAGTDIHTCRYISNSNQVLVGWTKAVSPNYGVQVFLLYLKL